MKGYVRQRGDRHYAVIYEGRDPVTGKELARMNLAPSLTEACQISERPRRVLRASRTLLALASSLRPVDVERLAQSRTRPKRVD